MPGEIGKIHQKGHPSCKDTTPPKQLMVDSAQFGTFTPQGGNNIDPLVLQFSNVEPGCKLQFVNLSENPAADWSGAAQLPGDTLKPLDDGRYGLVLSDAMAQKLGIQPGDVFRVRQVDAAGNASVPTTVSLNQLGGQKYEQMADDRAKDIFDTQPISGYGYFTPYGDKRAPVVLTDRVTLAAGDKEGQAVLSGNGAVEPGATVIVVNDRTLERFTAVVGDDGNFSLPVNAACGDPLHISAVDHDHVATDLGVLNFDPGTDAGPTTPPASGTGSTPTSS